MFRLEFFLFVKQDCFTLSKTVYLSKNCQALAVRGVATGEGASEDIGTQPWAQAFESATTHFAINLIRVFKQKFIPKYALFLEKGCENRRSFGGSALKPPLDSESGLRSSPRVYYSFLLLQLLISRFKR